VSGDGVGRVLTFPGKQSTNLPVERDPADLEPRDTSFEVALDDEPVPAKRVPVDVVAGKDPVLLPVIPEHLQTWSGVKSTAVRFVGRQWHRTKFHATRSPKYLFWGVVYALWGFIQLIRKQIRWWWVSETASLRRHAVETNAHKEWAALHRIAGDTRYRRARWILIEVILATGSGVALWFLAPWWAWVAVGLCLIPPLAHLGRPTDKPIIHQAVVTPRFRKLNSDIVLRAYYAAGLGHPDKPDQKIEFGSTMAIDKTGSGTEVLVILPYGKGLDDAVRAKSSIASGLDVSVSQVYLTRDKDSHRKHWLFVAFIDPLSIPAGRTPLLDGKKRDIWRPAPMGLNERGERVAFTLVFWSMLFGAPPRKGKSWTCRQLALYAALDPYVRLSVFDGKGSPDWRLFSIIAHTYGFGLLPDRKQGDPIENLLATLRAAKREILERNARLSELPTSVCPEGKLTRDIARNKAYKMPVWVIVLDEIQEYLTSDDQKACLEIAQLLVSIVKVGPSVGVIVLSATQRPSGVGSGGEVKKLFTDYRDNHLARFALKTPSWKFSDLILGDGAYSEGFDSSALPVGDEYRGIGILYNAPVDNCTVRCYLADGEDTERILLAARKHREACGTLDGMAAGEELTMQPRDPLADTLDAFLPGETWVSWTRLAERLADQLPERYTNVNRDSLSATLLGLKLGIESVTGACDSTDSGRARGVKRAALERAIERRDREESGG
jgi:DNA segregation ATPase FtsK/SpoIIIE, S-DNA-T family